MIKRERRCARDGALCVRRVGLGADAGQHSYAGCAQVRSSQQHLERHGPSQVHQGRRAGALDWDHKAVEPLLAKSLEVSTDKRTCVFRLRDDITFRSGKKSTAADVFYWFNRLADPDAKSLFCWRLGDINSVTTDDLHTAVLPVEAPLL